MNQDNLITYTLHDKDRKNYETPIEDEARSPFGRDRARIIHSTAFRRLQGKTQVFASGEGDFFRSRLTHSLEVAQIAKGLALHLRVADTDLVEAISLVHDIGHPPFGHAGENELNKLMSRYGGFEANAQNIRIFTQLECKSHQYDGLNLTRAVIDGQLKYKKAFSEDREKEDGDKFVYDDDLCLVNWASEKATEDAGGLGVSWKSIECEIMDWADDIAYAVHDLEDSLHAGFIDQSTFDSVEDPRLRRISLEVARKLSRSEEDVSEAFSELMKLIYECLYQNSGGSSNETNSRDYRKQRKTNRKQLTRFLIDRYIKCTKVDKRPNVSSNAHSQRYFYKIHVPDELRLEVRLLSGLIGTYVYGSPQLRTLEEKGKHIIRCLFLKFMRGKNADSLLPDDFAEYLRKAETPIGRARVVSDYIAGMTDDHAQKTYARLYLPDRGSIYEVL